MSFMYNNALEDEVLTLHQWDLYQQIVISGAPADQTSRVLLVSGCCGKQASIVPYIEHDNLLVMIPNDMLVDYGALSVYVYQTDENGHSITLDRVKIPIRQRPRPSNYASIIEETEREHGVLRLSVGQLDMKVLG